MMLKPLWCLQVYNSTARAFPRRFVLPLHVTSETATGRNLNTRPSSQATCVKTDRDTVRRRRREVSAVQSC